MSNQVMSLPGFDELLADPVDEMDDGIGNDAPGTIRTRWFDTAQLPDAPDYQRVAFGSQPYIVYLVCPNEDYVRRTLKVFTAGKRNSIPAGSTMFTIDMLFKTDKGDTYLEYLEKLLEKPNV
jgi:hypothetical protein